jgi:CRP-like cAMP-binding protein
MPTGLVRLALTQPTHDEIALHFPAAVEGTREPLRQRIDLVVAAGPRRCYGASRRWPPSRSSSASPGRCYASRATPDGVWRPARRSTSLSRQDLAELAGATLYTVSRTFSAWTQDGIVASGRRRVVVFFEWVRALRGLALI